jgi:protein TonB
MPLYLALLLSLILHTALILAPTWLEAKQPPLPAASIEARLLPQEKPAAMADAVSTEPSSTDTAAIPERPAALPRTLQGRALRRAQSALSEHLFYPPEAIAHGLEGEVILLLTLAENGQLVSATVARSSGHALLDQAALDAAQRIGHLSGNPRQTLFPVRFSLQ